ncbi:MAG: MIP/aquaporin family protein [Solirubrobacterales bacterium]
MQDRGLAAYIAELVGTFFLVFFITSVATLFVATGNQAQFGSDFAVVGLVNGLVLFAMIAIFGGVSGGHFNPAVTVAVAAARRIDPVDAVVYILAQLSGGVLGALLTKGLLVDEGRAGHYGATQVSDLLGGNFQGFVVEGIGTLVLVLAVLAVALGTRASKEWAPLAIGLTLAFVVMVAGPLTGGAVNPARWFGPALVDNTWGDVWPYVLGPLAAAIVGAALFRFVIEAGQQAAPPPPGQPGKPSAPAKS